MVVVQLSLTEVAVTEPAFKVGDFLMETEEAEAAEPVTEASPQDELEEQPEADET